MKKFPKYVTTYDGYIGAFQHLEYGVFPVYRFPGGARIADGWEVEHGSDCREDLVKWNSARFKKGEPNAKN